MAFEKLFSGSRLKDHRAIPSARLKAAGKINVAFMVFSLMVLI